MNRTSRPYAQWGIAFLLGVILTLLLSDRGDPLSALAQSAQPRLGARGIFALTGQVTKDSYGLFLIDVDAGTICVYRYFANRPEHERFQLVAVRSFIQRYSFEKGNAAKDTRVEFVIEGVANLGVQANRVVVSTGMRVTILDSNLALVIETGDFTGHARTKGVQFRVIGS